MNIAIFGDSFADDQADHLVQDEISWIDVLRQAGHDVTLYSKVATSLYYSWKKYSEFKKTEEYESTDLVIFVGTIEGREEVVYKDQSWDVTSLGHVELIMSYDDRVKENPIIYKLFDALKLYWQYFKDRDKDLLLHECLLDKIKREPKLLLIDIRGGPQRENTSLIQLSLHELSLLVPSIDTWEDESNFFQQYNDRRKCHLTTNNNVMVGKKILHAINTMDYNIVFSLEDVLVPEHDYTRYFLKHDT